MKPTRHFLAIPDFSRSELIDVFDLAARMGYQFRGGDLDTDSFLITAGFDQLLASWATFAADLISEFQVGTSHLALPPDATLQYPFHRTIDATNIPDRRDDLVNASLGAKLTIPAGVTFLANALFPLNRGGMTMAEVERAAIEAALHEHRGNRREAAEVLGIGERTLYRKIKAYHLE